MIIFMNSYSVLRQDIVSTPRAELDRDVVKDNRDDVADAIIEVRHLALEITERRLIVKRRVLSDVIIIINIAQGFL